MTSLAKQIMDDLRAGRQTRRVLLTLAAIAFLLAILFELLQQGHYR